MIPSAELLVRIARSRDREAFAALFERYARRIAGFLRDERLAPSIRDELVQEIMLRVWHRADQYDPARASVDSWIFAIVRNARTDHFRRPAMRAQVEPLDPGLVDDRTPPVEEEVLRRRDARDVRTAIDDLPEEQASILRAAYFQHKSLRAIASETGVALGTVKSRVRLAMKRLRHVLGVTRDRAPPPRGLDRHPRRRHRHAGRGPAGGQPPVAVRRLPVRARGGRGGRGRTARAEPGG